MTAASRMLAAAGTLRSRARVEFELAIGGLQMRTLERAVSRAAGLRPDVTTDGIVCYARPPRQGLPLVGIHGFGGDKETWLMCAALVGRRRGLALVDLPGHGRSPDVADDKASIRHHAEAVLRVMDRVGLERAVLCGNSMGGGIALKIAHAWPDRVAGLVLVASVGRDLHDERLSAWIDGDNPLIPRESDVERFIALVLERPPPMVPRSVIRYAITQRARRAGKLQRLFRGVVLGRGDDGVPQELGTIVQPALVVHGEQDRIIPQRVGEELARALPNAELVLMKRVGHTPQLEAPLPTARLIERFARQLDEQDSPRSDGTRSIIDERRVPE